MGNSSKDDAPLAAEFPEDELGPAKVLYIREPRLALESFVVVDNLARGPALGGLRMAPDVTLAECARLARAMTLKNSAAGLPHGGAKAVLRADPRMPRERKEQLIRAFAHALRAERNYIVGPDMGTDESCMAWIYDEIGRASGLPPELGGIPLDRIGATGWGLAHCAETAAPAAGIALEGARVAVQGFGAVGRNAADFLVRKGARLVAASDSTAALYDAGGLDVGELIRAKEEGKPFRSFDRLRPLESDAILDVECDIWIPAARSDVVREDNAHRLRARLVLEGANIPITPGAEAMLAARGVMVVPDFIANAGGVICAAMELRGATQTAAMEAVAEKVRTNTAAVIALARSQRKLPREAAFMLAADGVKNAMVLRRFGIL